MYGSGAASTNTMLPKVAIVYLSFHSEPYLDDVVAALKRLTYPKDRVEFVIVNNPHPEFGLSVRAIEDRVMPLSGTEIPHVTLLPQKKNLGFAGGNNVGVTWAIDHGFDYVYFHNDDGFMDANCLQPLVNVMEADRSIGLAQSLLLLYPETEYINTSGNVFHYLGFGYCNNYRTPLKDFGGPAVRDIDYASGAGLMVSAATVRAWGMWDDDFFLYHEDLEWSLRLRVAGYRVVMVKDSLFYHKYQFSRSVQKFFWMERNRYAILLMFFRLSTLILLSPMLLVMEVGLWLFAMKHGWVEERVKLYTYWLNPKHWPLWMKKRRYIQSIRKLNDRDILRAASPVIAFQEKSMENPILMKIGNPMMRAYYWFLMKVIFW